ncbi:hypothetical protein BDV97DRAFT_361651 [Delphinella strobiligena]|nr:hypothetical protein BDV97DRAFT_361651 [Delphinella strobiligena]
MLRLRLHSSSGQHHLYSIMSPTLLRLDKDPETPIRRSSEPLAQLSTTYSATSTNTHPQNATPTTMAPKTKLNAESLPEGTITLNATQVKILQHVANNPRTTLQVKLPLTPAPRPCPVSI